MSTTAKRLKARNLARDPRASLHVEGDDFWHFAVAEGRNELSDIATEPGADAVTELRAIHTSVAFGVTALNTASELLDTSEQS